MVDLKKEKGDKKTNQAIHVRRLVSRRIYKTDPNTGNWWLVFGKENKGVGYWPKSLFSSLSDFASLIGWGGETYSRSISPSPPMGSGRLPKEGYRKACYQRQLQLVDETNSLRDPLPKKIYTECDQPKCYNGIHGSLKGLWRYYFLFGGPGGNCGK
ncbi:protein neprosin-like [Magnolia sinica]|uniref:protein neprosin-like n=1 Tax=Magnolia sinica TaxID=86752 RepID=UPI00265ACB39|nr:protein neprosin-like [Magnolia sinica]